MRRALKPCHERRGTSVVEFAVCLPVLLAFTFGTIQFSRMVQLQHTLRLAAFEGARAGVTLDSSSADVQNKVAGTLAVLGVNNPTVTITPNPLAYTSPTITVTVSADPTQNAWLNWFPATGNPISATVTLNREVQAVSSP